MIRTHEPEKLPKPALLCCPCCGFDDAAYADHVKKAEYYAGKKEEYMPRLYKDRFLNKWVVECLNCGTEVIFNAGSEQEHADLWNALPREKPKASKG